ncbi:lysine exporter LysO family protein [Photorhabdus sp. SF281]|uniref:lysine exporter LysO family protein n=1 Tax=Photorhabdus sp. SF281 TaxID=3459527 RepID=UPI004044D70F
MKESITSILIICFLLALGFFLGKLIKENIKAKLVGSITMIVMILLFMMGIELGEIFINSNLGTSIIIESLVLSSLISISTFLILFKRKFCQIEKKGKQSFLDPFIGCFKAIMFFCLGVLVYKLTNLSLAEHNISSNYALYTLILFVGLDLVNFSFKDIKINHIKIPIFTIAGTVIGALIFSMLTDYSISESMLISSGYGWFSLSGPMVTSMTNPHYGSLSFMTDLFREIFSIFFLYFLGKSYPQGAIGISGAAALDSALPFIKENCTSEDIKYAIASGFVLTLLAPLFISVFVGLV